MDALGIAVAAIGFGFVYGLAAREAGFSPIEVFAMSTIVFGGGARPRLAGRRAPDLPPLRAPSAVLGGPRAVAAPCPVLAARRDGASAHGRGLCVDHRPLPAGGSDGSARLLDGSHRRDLHPMEYRVHCGLGARG